MKKSKVEKIGIGMGHVVRALQATGFGEAEIMAMKKAMYTGNFKNIEFGHDCYSKQWEDMEELKK